MFLYLAVFKKKAALGGPQPKTNNYEIKQNFSRII
jgi:hypothetical protein